VQRFSTDWHANSFAGSTVRKISRGMWAFDILNDTVLIAVFPSIIMLVGSTVLLGAMWPLMGAIVGIGSLIYIGITALTSVAWVAPAASLANSWDTRMGGALADAISCNAVVKGFGGETREDERLGKVVAKWRKRTRRVWWRGTFNGINQQLMLVIFRTAIIGAAVLLWAGGQADAGDVALVLTRSSCCRDICATSVSTSAISSARSTTWKSWWRSWTSHSASRTGPMQSRLRSRRAGSGSAT